MTNYTQGRLTLGKWASASGGPELEYVNGSAVQQVFACQPMESADHNANARRLAACWNAFDTFDTASIEKLSTIGGVRGVTVVANENLDQLDAARALLADVLSTSARTSINAALVARIAAFNAGQPAPDTIPAGWVLNGADLSIIANGGNRAGSVTLVRTGADRDRWHEKADADVIPLYVTGRGMTFAEALRDAIEQALAAPAVPS